MVRSWWKWKINALIQGLTKNKEYSKEQWSCSGFQISNPRFESGCCQFKFKNIYNMIGLSFRLHFFKPDISPSNQTWVNLIVLLVFQHQRVSDREGVSFPSTSYWKREPILRPSWNSDLDLSTTTASPCLTRVNSRLHLFMFPKLFPCFASFTVSHHFKRRPGIEPVSMELEQPGTFERTPYRLSHCDQGSSPAYFLS